MFHRVIRSTALVASLLAVGCHAGTPLGANLQGLSALEADARKQLGGDAYTSFKLAPTIQGADDSRAATKLVYLMTDEANHQSAWSQKMLDMMSGWKSPKVHNVVFRDGTQNDDTRLYYLTGDKGGPQQSLLAPGVNEVQSNNPKVFSETIGWTFSQFPGKKHYLELYTHGAGVFGVGCDEKQTDPAGKALPQDANIPVMRMQNFAEALRQGLKGRSLDLLYFRACLMGNVEALTEIADTTRYAIASEEVSGSVDNSNLTMTQQFEDMAEQNADPEDVARQLAISAHAKHPQDAKGNYMGYMTFAAFDLSKMKDLNSSINSLSNTLLASMPQHGKEILAAYDATPTYNGKKAPEEYYEEQRDLWAFTASLLHNVNDPAVQKAASRVRDAQTALTVHERDAYDSASNGLSILMPARTGSKVDTYASGFMDAGYTKLKFAQTSAWPKFLHTVLAAK